MIRAKTRHQIYLADDLSKRLATMAKGQRRPRSELIAEAVEGWFNQRSLPPLDERITRRLDRIARDIHSIERSQLITSESLNRLIRHQLIQACALPPPGAEARALGQKRYEEFLNSLARILASGADYDDGRALQSSTIENQPSQQSGFDSAALKPTEDPSESSSG